jgi:hypothetical protein
VLHWCIQCGGFFVGAEAVEALVADELLAAKAKRSPLRRLEKLLRMLAPLSWLFYDPHDPLNYVLDHDPYYFAPRDHPERGDQETRD